MLKSNNLIGFGGQALAIPPLLLVETPTVATHAATGNPANFSFAVNVGTAFANRLMLIVMYRRSGVGGTLPGAVSSASIGGVPLNIVGISVNATTINSVDYFWVFDSSLSGSQTFSVNTAASTSRYFGAQVYNFSGAAASPIGAGGRTTYASGTGITHGVTTTAADSIVVGAICAQDNRGPYTPASGSEVCDSVITISSFWGGYTSAPTIGSYTTGGTQTTTGAAGAFGVEIKRTTVPV